MFARISIHGATKTVKPARTQSGRARCGWLLQRGRIVCSHNNQHWLCVVRRCIRTPQCQIDARLCATVYTYISLCVCVCVRVWMRIREMPIQPEASYAKTRGTISNDRQSHRARNEHEVSRAVAVSAVSGQALDSVKRTQALQSSPASSREFPWFRSISF